MNQDLATTNCCGSQIEDHGGTHITHCPDDLNHYNILCLMGLPLFLSSSLRWLTVIEMGGPFRQVLNCSRSNSNPFIMVSPQILPCLLVHRHSHSNSSLTCCKQIWTFAIPHLIVRQSRQCSHSCGMCTTHVAMCCDGIFYILIRGYPCFRF